MAEVLALLMAALLATALAHYIKRWLRPLAARADLPRWPRRLVIAGMVLAPSFLGVVLILGLRALFASFRPARSRSSTSPWTSPRCWCWCASRCMCFSVSLGPNSWIRAWELRLTFVLWAAISFQVLGWFSGRRTHARRHRPGPRQDHVQPLGAAQEHRGHRRLPGRHQPDRAHHRAARHEARRPGDLDAHRHLQVLHVLAGRPRRPAGHQCLGRRPHRARPVHRRHRPRPGVRPAGHRQQFRLRLRAAARQVHQARRRHQLHRHHRHQHRELRLGAGAARPLHRRARPRRRRNAGAEPEPHHQLGHQLELLRPARAHPPAGA